jgi:hypothetical protein
MHYPVRLTLCAVLSMAATSLHAQAPAADSTAATNSLTHTIDLAPAAALTPATLAPTAAPQVSTAGAPMTGLRAAVHAPEHTDSARPAASASHANLGQARAMMVVGVAGLIVGAIIGDTPGTIIMIGGALVGLKGLYDYLQ